MAMLLLVTLALLQAADVWTTRRVLAAGGREANPAMAWAMARLGRWWWAPKVVLVLGAAGAAALLWPDAATLGLVLACGIYVFVVGHNLRQMTKGRE